MKTWDEMKALEGKRVRVILDWYDSEAFSEGVLEALDDSGQVWMLKDDGRRTCSWPALDMELL